MLGGVCSKGLSYGMKDDPHVGADLDPRDRQYCSITKAITARPDCRRKQTWLERTLHRCGVLEHAVQCIVLRLDAMICGQKLLLGPELLSC